MPGRRRRARPRPPRRRRPAAAPATRPPGPAPRIRPPPWTAVGPARPAARRGCRRANPPRRAGTRTRRARSRVRLVRPTRSGTSAPPCRRRGRRRPATAGGVPAIRHGRRTPATKPTHRLAGPVRLSRAGRSCDPAATALPSRSAPSGRAPPPCSAIRPGAAAGHAACAWDPTAARRAGAPRSRPRPGAIRPRCGRPPAPSPARRRARECPERRRHPRHSAAIGAPARRRRTDGDGEDLTRPPAGERAAPLARPEAVPHPRLRRHWSSLPAVRMAGGPDRRQRPHDRSVVVHVAVVASAAGLHWSGETAPRRHVLPLPFVLGTLGSGLAR